MKLLSLNIQGNNHLKRVVSLIERESPDIICLQEVLEVDAPLLKKATGMDGLYVPSVFVDINNRAHLQVNAMFGSMVLTKYPTKFSTFYYMGNPEHVPLYSTDMVTFNYNRFLIIAEFEQEGKQYRIITTHFTWAPDGSSTPLQFEHMNHIFEKLKEFDEFIFCGDFNAPRGGATWNMLAEKYKDNIPKEITTTLDPHLHRAKNLQYVVDGIFSTPAYEISSVKVIADVSDHMAIVADIQKAA